MKKIEQMQRSLFGGITRDARLSCDWLTLGSPGGNYNYPNFRDNVNKYKYGEM